MANPRTSYVGMTGDSTIDATTHGYKWSLDSTRTVDFSVSNGFFYGESWANPGLVAQKFGAVLNTITPYANIKFNFIGSFVDPVQASNAGSEMNLSLTGSTAIFNNSSTWARGYFPDPNDGGKAGDIFLNTNSMAVRLPSYDPGSAGWALLMHEIGHTLGLKHPHDDGGTGRPTFSQLGLDDLNLDVFTVMSYEDDANWNLITQDPATPMILDVLALQALYGKNLQTYAGNSAHYITNTGNYSTIWDASGIDVINAGNATEGWVITLPTEAWSTIVDTKVGAAVPVSQFTSRSPTAFKWLAGDFENIVGSKYSDVITANQFNNKIFGGGGDDYIDAGSGFDTVFYSGSLSRYLGSVGDETIISDTLANGDGYDTLINVERVKFSDKSIALDVAPTENAGSVYMLYKAAFDRPPDEGGMGFWIAQKDGGADIVTSIAQGFVNSSEFISKYGSDPTNASYVNNLYQNVLGRAGEAEGVAFWTNQMDAGRVSKAEALVQFATLEEGSGNVAPLIANGIAYTEWVG